MILGSVMLFVALAALPPAAPPTLSVLPGEVPQDVSPFPRPSEPPQ